MSAVSQPASALVHEPVGWCLAGVEESRDSGFAQGDILGQLDLDLELRSNYLASFLSYYFPVTNKKI